MRLIEIVELVLLAGLAGGFCASLLSKRAERRREIAYSVTQRLLSGRPDEFPTGMPVEQSIRDAEARSGIRLTWHARQMLMIPLVESIELGEDLPFGMIDESIQSIIATIAREPSFEDRHRRSRGARSVIRGFHRRFCNIPPFCDRTDAEPPV